MACLPNNEYVTQIPDMTFFQGDTISIPFSFFDGDDEPIDLRGVDIYWYCAPYGKPKFPALVLDNKSVQPDGTTKIIVKDETPNICYVNLSIDDTKKLTYGKYIHQPVISITQKSGKKRYIRAEGNIIFKPMIYDFN